MHNTNRPTGMFGFTIVWPGQIISVLATNMSAFALTIWVFEKTGSATALGLMQVFFITPLLVITPFAGVLVDRHNRKLMMMVSDLMAGLATINDSISLGLVQSAGAIGGIVGGLAMSAWDGFKRRVHGVLGGWITASFFFALMGLGTWLPFWVATNALSALFVPLINGSNQAIWQSKVAPDVQGRVFSARTLIAWMTNPISPLIAGTLADYILEPAMRVPSGLSSLFGWLVPPGPGAGGIFYPPDSPGRGYPVRSRSDGDCRNRLKGLVIYRPAVTPSAPDIFETTLQENILS